MHTSGTTIATENAKGNEQGPARQAARCHRALFAHREHRVSPVRPRSTEQMLAFPGVVVIDVKSTLLSSLSKPFGHRPMDVEASPESAPAGLPSPAPATDPL